MTRAIRFVGAGFGQQNPTRRVGHFKESRKRPASGFLTRVRRRVARRDMKIKILVSWRVRTGGMIRLQPTTGIERQDEAGGFGFDDAHGVVGVRKTIAKCNAFVAGHEVNFNSAADCVSKHKTSEIQAMIYSRLDARQQFVFFPPAGDLSGAVKTQAVLKVLIVTAQSERRLLNDHFATARRLVIQTALVKRNGNFTLLVW